MNASGQHYHHQHLGRGGRGGDGRKPESSSNIMLLDFGQQPAIAATVDFQGYQNTSEAIGTQQRANGASIFTQLRRKTMITTKNSTAAQGQAEAEPQFFSSLAADARLCVMCHEAQGQGKWGVCPECRRRIVEGQAARERARPAPTQCVCCHTKFINPRRGQSLCPSCLWRFNPGART